MRNAFCKVAGVVCMASGLIPASLKAQTDAHLTTEVRTFYLNATGQADQNEMVTALRNVLDPNDRIFVVSGRAALVISAPPDQMQLAERLLHELDRPRKLFRLIYTLNTLENGKTVGSQHYAAETVAGQRTTLRQISRVPAMTADAQYTMFDVGVTVDATLEEADGGLRLKSKVDDTSIASDRAEGAPHYPVTRSLTLEGTSVLTLGKVVELGSLDVPGSTRHTQVEVVAELVK